MERAILGITLRGQIRNKIIRERTGVKDVVEEAAALKWRRAGHIARSPKDNFELETPPDAEVSRKTPDKMAGQYQQFCGDWLDESGPRPWFMEEAFVQQWTATS